MKSSNADQRLTVHFGEKIIAANVPALKDQIMALLEEETDVSEVTADFSGVEYIDSTGITLVIGLYKTTSEMNKSFNVTGARNEIKNLFSIMQLDKVFRID